MKLTELANFKFQPCTLSSIELSHVLQKHYRKIFENTGNRWYPHRCTELAKYVVDGTKHQVLENKSFEHLKKFLEGLKNFDQRSRVRIQKGNRVSIIQVIPYIFSNMIEVSGFQSPREIKEIHLDDQENISWLEFTDGSTYPDRHFIEAGKGGGELDGTATLFYPDAQSAHANLSAILLAAPESWKISTVNLQEEINMRIQNFSENPAQSVKIKEAKTLKKRVRVVKGRNAGKTGWIREIKLGAFKGAPKSYFVDLDDGTQENNVPGSALRLIRDE